eukprot:XP_011679866.1 PREDICTED: zinc finger protein 260-like isoform X2 [Strongylocentrotus purpuratus]
MEEESSMESYIKKEDFLFYEAETGKSDRDQVSLQEDVKQSCVDEEGWIHMCAKPEMPSTALSSDPQESKTVLIALGQESVLEDDERIGENSQESSERESMPPTHQERNSVSFDVLIKEEIDSEQNGEGGRCFNEEKGESGDNDRGGNNESCECKVTEPTGSFQKKHERTDSGGKTSLQCFFCDRSFSKECHLTRHLQSHVGIKTYDTFHCSLCKKSFLSNSDLVKHKTKCTGEKPYACIHCTSTFAKQMDLKVHSRTHNQVKNILTVQTQDQTDHSYSQSQSQCSYCKRAFKTKSNLDSHIGTMTFESSYSCSHCSSTFPSKCSLTLHNRTHLEQKSYQCSLCSKTFASIYVRTRHMKWHTGEKPHECSHCGKRFFGKGNLNSHIRIHTKGKLYKCDHCSKEFSYKKTLNLHMIEHSEKILQECSVRKEKFATLNSSIECSQNESHSDDIEIITPRKTMNIESSYSCSHCSSSFPSKCILTLHNRTHHEQKSYQCSLCSKTFTTAQGKKTHMRRHTDEKRHQCSYCSKKFFDKTHLNEHVRIHTKEKPYKCDHCNQGFSYKKTFNLHMIKNSRKILPESSVCKEKLATLKCSKECSQNESQSHIKTCPEEKPYQCSECNKTFSAECSLILHERTHPRGPQKMHGCPLCSKRFRNEYSVYVHMRKHTEEKRYQCSYCPKAYSQKGQLADHIRSHTGERPFKCSQCDMAFMRKCYLQKHVKLHSGKKSQ